MTDRLSRALIPTVVTVVTAGVIEFIFADPKADFSSSSGWLGLAVMFLTVLLANYYITERFYKK